MYGGGMQPRQRIRVTSAGGVVYRWDKDNPLFLLLASNKRGVWCLPKGLIEEGEDEVTTAMREVREETGVSRVKLRWGRSMMRWSGCHTRRLFIPCRTRTRRRCFRRPGAISNPRRAIPQKPSRVRASFQPVRACYRGLA